MLTQFNGRFKWRWRTLKFTSLSLLCSYVGSRHNLADDNRPVFGRYIRGTKI